MPHEPQADGGEPGHERSTDPCIDAALRALLDGLPLLAWMTDPAGRLAHANRSWAEFTGDVVGTASDGLLDRILPEDRPKVRRHIADALKYGQPFECEFQLRRSDGQYRWLACFASPYFDANEVVAGVIGLSMDLTDRRQREEQLAFMATHDSLTGLPNRRMFESTLARAVSRARRGTQSVLLVLDIDNFKSYNDARGHLEGDQALINFSLLLQRHVRAGDLLARIGGDEFAVLFEQTTVPEAVEIAERMRAAAAKEEFVAKARVHDLGFSGGLVPVDGLLEARSAFDLADEAMYEAKEQGRNRVVVLRSDEASGSRDSDRLAGRVREALTEQNFVLYYQPVIRLADDSVAYYESLVRMPAEDARLLLPGDFLPTIERLGLMPRLTRLIVGMVVRALDEHSGAHVSINLSRGDLADDSLPRFVDEELRRQGVEPSRLAFEISEAAVVGNLSSARNWFDRLRPLGCRFVLDEFGAGLGLFGLLRDLPFDQVKLDGSIVSALSADGENTAFVEAVRGLIESQGHTAVASWVEDEALLRRVLDVGFEMGQGYHLQVPSPDLGELIRKLG